MGAPGFFILVTIVLLVLFGACMVTGAVWLFLGWRKKVRSVQFLSALPFGVGLFIIGPLLLLAVIMVVWWLIADWRAIPSATQAQGKPNQSLQPKRIRADAWALIHSQHACLFVGFAAHATL
jgi:hypothetical protein